MKWFKDEYFEKGSLKAFMCVLAEEAERKSGWKMIPIPNTEKAIFF